MARLMLTVLNWAGTTPAMVTPWTLNRRNQERRIRSWRPASDGLSTTYNLGLPCWSVGVGRGRQVDRGGPVDGEVEIGVVLSRLDNVSARHGTATD